jgi:hypothetical protein
MNPNLISPWTLTKLREYREEILRIAEQHGASNIRVFGSIVRNEADDESDVDLLIEQDWTQLSAWGGMGLVVALEDLLECKVDVATLEELKPSIRKRVSEEAVPLCVNVMTVPSWRIS